MQPYGNKPLKIKARRAGDPTAAEMQILAECVKRGRACLEHPRGEERSPIVTLAFEMQERGWLNPPGEPELQRKVVRPEASLPSEQQLPTGPDQHVDVRVWCFTVTQRGREAYAQRMAQFGVSA